MGPWWRARVPTTAHGTPTVGPESSQDGPRPAGTRVAPPPPTPPRKEISMIDAFTRPKWFGVALPLVLVLACVSPASARDCSNTPTAPLAIDKDVFTGAVRGLLGSNEVILSTALMNFAWTTFFDPNVSAAAVKSLVENPAAIPSLKCGDVINLEVANASNSADKTNASAAKTKLGKVWTRRLRVTGTFGAAYRTLETLWPAQSVMVVPVVDFDAANKGTVEGFAQLKIIQIKSKGTAKFVDATIVSLDFDPATPAN